MDATDCLRHFRGKHLSPYQFIYMTLNKRCINTSPKRDKVTGEWRKLHSGELHNLYSSPYITRQIKSRRMWWAGHVARMGEGRNVYRVLVGKPEGKNHLKDQGVDGRMG
jgi:hypothetical protein